MAKDVAAWTVCCPCLSSLLSSYVLCSINATCAEADRVEKASDILLRVWKESVRTLPRLADHTLRNRALVYSSLGKKRNLRPGKMISRRLTPVVSERTKARPLFSFLHVMQLVLFTLRSFPLTTQKRKILRCSVKVTKGAGLTTWGIEKFFQHFQTSSFSPNVLHWPQF